MVPASAVGVVEGVVSVVVRSTETGGDDAPASGTACTVTPRPREAASPTIASLYLTARIRTIARCSPPTCHPTCHPTRSKEAAPNVTSATIRHACAEAAGT